MIRDEIGLQLHGRFTAVAGDFATELNQKSCDTIMNMTGSYDGVKRTYKYTLEHITYIIFQMITHNRIYTSNITTCKTLSL